MKRSSVGRHLWSFSVCHPPRHHLPSFLVGGRRGDDGGGLGRWGGLRVDDDLDHEVLLDLGVLQPRFVREQLAGEEPALLGGVDVLLGLQLLLQLPYGVGHAGAEAQVLARGESHLHVEQEKGKSGGSYLF